MKIKLFLLISAFFFSTPKTEKTVFWGPTGHRTTGQIAEMHLTKKAKRKS